jgi:hypothetical protein
MHSSIRLFIHNSLQRPLFLSLFACNILKGIPTLLTIKQQFDPKRVDAIF